MRKKLLSFAVVFLVCVLLAFDASAQVAPSAATIAGYEGLHRAVHLGDLAAMRQLIAEGAGLEVRDGSGRTPLHVAAFASNEDAVRLLAEAGADVDALENQAYDIITIAAVANDVGMLETALSVGADPGTVTSPYDGTALIAAAHLGHHEIVSRLIAAGAPLDHVNNLGWTAMIEVVVLGDGGDDHVRSLAALLDAGADRSIGDRQGVTPLQHAASRGYEDMVRLLQTE